MEQNELFGWVLDQIDKILKTLITLVAVVAHFLFGGWTVPLKILVVFISFDYLAGLGAAFVGKRLDSSVGIKGVIKKLGYFMLVAVANLLDLLFCDAVGYTEPIIRTACTWWLLGVEGLSILENLGEIGAPIPPVLLDALKQVKERKCDVNNLL